MVEKDRRASQRFKSQPGSNVFYIEGAGAIRDLSMDGVFILDSEPLEVGTHITFSLRLGNETVAFQGIVRRTVPQEGMGIQFTAMPREARRHLLSRIASIT
jgi:PilZ domain-containing protein